MMKIFAFFSAVIFAAAGFAADVRTYGGKIEISNSWLKAEISLAQGGRVSQLTDLKKQKQLTDLNNLPGGSGVFGDYLLDPTSKKQVADYSKQTYRLLSKKQGSEARVVLESPAGNRLTIRKTFILRDHSDTLFVEYELTNPGERDVNAVFRCGNAFRFSGEKKYTLHFPEGKRGASWVEPVSSPGKNRIQYETESTRNRDIFFFRPQRDYVSVTGKSSGIILNTPFPVLDFFYTYQNANPQGMAIVDWFTTPFCLPPLSKGKAEAVLLTVLDDPLAKYKYKFTTSVKLIDPADFSYEKYRGFSKEKKSTAFLPVNKLDTSYTDFSTPAWVFNPHPFRKHRILAVAAAHGNHEMSELNRRLNFEMDLLDTSNASNFKSSAYFGWNMPEPEKILDSLLKKKPEIILICGHNERGLTRKHLSKIIRHIESGASFIYVGNRNLFPSLIPEKGGKTVDPSVFDGVLKEKLPVFGKILEYSRGTGRVLHVQMPMAPHNIQWVREARAVIPHVGDISMDFPYWDYYFALYGKLFRYAGKSMPPARIRDAGVKAGRISVNLELSQDLPDGKLTMIVNSPAGRIDFGTVWNRALRAGKHRIELALPESLTQMDGEYRLHFLLENARSTLDWFALIHKNRTASAIEKLTVNTPVKGDVVSGKVLIRGQGTLILRLRETVTGRTAGFQKYSVKAGLHSFELKRQILSAEKMYELEFELFHGKRRISLLRQPLLMQPGLKKKATRIQPLIWGAHFASWRDHYFNRELADAGFDVYLAPMAFTKKFNEFQRENEYVLSTGMEYAPLGIEHIKTSVVSSTVRTPCLRCPAYRKRIEEKSRRVAEKMKTALAEKCFISDEITLGKYFNSPHDFCTSVWCLDAFRKYLHKKYNGDLSALNKNWKTAFADWHSVVPLTALQSGRKKNHVSFIEHRTFMFSNLTEICQQISEKIRAVSGGETGISGMDMTKLYQGFDLMATMPFLKSSAFYHTPFTLDVIRSCMTDSHQTGSYSDYGVRYQIWEQLIGGLRMPSVWWYGHLMRRGDARLSKEGKYLQAIFRAVRDSGAEKILSSGTRTGGSAALIWSAQSLAAAAASAFPSPVTAIRYKGCLDSWSQLLRDIGLDSPDVLTPEKISTLTPDRYPLVILPLTQVLSDQEISALQQYVRNGGFLIADYAPGVRDQFGVFRIKNPLDGVFGLTIKSPEKNGGGTLQINGKTVNGAVPGSPAVLQNGSIALASLRSEVQGIRMGGIRLKATSREVAPAAILHTYGQGKTLYLNFLLPDYFSTDCLKEDQGKNVVQAMKYLFRKAGMNLPALHRLPCGSNYASYKYAGIRYLFLSRRKNDSSGQYTLELDGKFHVYDMLRGKYCGKQNAIQGQIEAAGVRFYALLPDVLPPFQVQISREGRMLQIRQAGRDLPGVLYRIKVYRNGRELRQLSVTSCLEKNTVVIDPGLEPEGKWQVEVVRIADRRKCVQSFQFNN